MITRRELLVGTAAAIAATPLRSHAWGSSSPVEGPAIRALRESVRGLLERAAGLRPLPPILIVGDGGTGRHLLAALIHRAGPRSGGRFVPANVSAFPEELIEVELYGYARGAFTTPSERLGLCHLAHEGTLFLGTIDDLSDARWAKIRKALIASSYSPPETDHFYPLPPVVLTLPQLRALGDDVQLLADHFLARHCRRFNIRSKALSPDARVALGEYYWPGNVRELSNLMECAAVHVESDRVRRRI